ncbi:MAG: hypothetical protein Kow006_13620 [Gammaproteobacteria bacterium]
MRRQRGFSIVTAIFVIVVLALLGAYLVSISSTQHATVSMGLQGARAYQAAQAGIEWGARMVITAPATMCGTTSTNTTFSLTSGALNGFDVSVDCVYTTHQERSDTYAVYVLTSRASKGVLGSLDYVSRTIRATVTNAP